MSLITIGAIPKSEYPLNTGDAGVIQIGEETVPVMPGAMKKVLQGFQSPETTNSDILVIPNVTLRESATGKYIIDNIIDQAENSEDFILIATPNEGNDLYYNRDNEFEEVILKEEYVGLKILAAKPKLLLVATGEGRVIDIIIVYPNAIIGQCATHVNPAVFESQAAMLGLDEDSISWVIYDPEDNHYEIRNETTDEDDSDEDDGSDRFANS